MLLDLECDYSRIWKQLNYISALEHQWLRQLKLTVWKIDTFVVVGESIWLDLPLITKMISFCKQLFPSVSYAYNGVPTYTSGTIGYIMCSVEKVGTRIRIIVVEYFYAFLMTDILFIYFELNETKTLWPWISITSYKSMIDLVKFYCMWLCISMMLNIWLCHCYQYLLIKLVS